MNVPRIRGMRRPSRPTRRVVELSAAQRDQVQAKQRAACLHVDGDDALISKIMSAPPGYLLAHGSGDVARHCRLLTPLPAPGEVRLVVTPGRSATEWRLDVASRDRPGLLAAFTGVLAARYLDVVQAVVATWDDHAALEAFVIRSPTPPDAAALQAACESSLSEPLSSEPLIDARVTFDHDASPITTRCDVQATDRVGLLHFVAVALAAAGADVHAASVSTAGGIALDRFDLSTRDGSKLDLDGERSISTFIRNGVPTLDARTGLDRKARNSMRRESRRALVL
jgi:UTP:GlnB (protein PII) uridylyltransferase